MRQLVLVGLLLIVSACGGDDATSKSAEDGSGDAANASENFSREVLEKLSERTLDGWRVQGARATDVSARVTFSREAPTAKGLTLNVVVKIGICPDDIALCYSIDPEDPGNKMWAKQARDAMAKQGARDAITSAGVVELQGGRRALGLYRAGYARSADGKGRGTTLGMDVRYHDGANAIHMMINASGEKKVSNSEELSAHLSKDDAVAAAREIFAVFADKF